MGFQIQRTEPSAAKGVNRLLTGSSLGLPRTRRSHPVGLGQGPGLADRPRPLAYGFVPSCRRGVKWSGWDAHLECEVTDQRRHRGSLKLAPMGRNEIATTSSFAGRFGRGQSGPITATSARGIWAHHRFGPHQIGGQPADRGQPMAGQRDRDPADPGPRPNSPEKK